MGELGIKGEGWQEAVWHFTQSPVVLLLSLSPKHWDFLEKDFQILLSAGFLLLTLRFSFTGTKEVIAKRSFHCTYLNSCCPSNFCSLNPVKNSPVRTLQASAEQDQLFCKQLTQNCHDLKLWKSTDQIYKPLFILIQSFQNKNYHLAVLRSTVLFLYSAPCEEYCREN